MKDALFGGVNAAVLTAMKPDLSPDPDRMAAHAKWLLANGCNGLGIMGTTGEANSFGLHERKAILEGLVARGIPASVMMPGTGCASLTDTVELTLHAKAQGCRGVLVLPPFYYKGPSDDGLFAYFSEVVNRVGGGIAIYLYHFPQQSAVPFSLDLIGRLLQAFPGVIKGVKDSSGVYANMKAMAENFAKDGFEVYSGSDEFLQQMLADGGAGCITAASNANSHWGGIVYAQRTGAEADKAQAMLTATRRAATSVPLIPGLREIIARSTGDDGWRTIRPPHLKLDPAQAEAVWTAWQAAGALPLPGLGVKAAAE
ncbi:dihydrodipicolinate synthase family protein [Siccirubricoccus sp. KC 17139]|uniref:Dihydrodipicolinate synthase family protein n=1 Tax=Siccirubricoccus soli TaxID=2899147 RepID=A0ABT1DDC4_9PROT|nr:dihydrodipicolinate synthase family protein [Siccirubricoccus soli]MCO6419932.1 dihydrodipicolinate synthase family protein [Siccirubricoccus soli]MCP2686067.1 dihydrodipicolinate synthase family protein [Siccirubricoccus soli]